MAADAETATQHAQQETARSQVAACAARAETGRVRADAGKMLDQVRAEAARERDELRADFRARAEHAERQANAYRDEPGQLHAARHDTTPPPETAAAQPALRPHGARPASRPPETGPLPRQAPRGRSDTSNQQPARAIATQIRPVD